MRNNFMVWIAFAFFVMSTVSLSTTIGLAEQVELTWWFRGGEPRFEQFTAAVIESFEHLHPNIKVTWEPTPPAWQDAVISRAAAGIGPDVFEFWHTHARNFGEQGFVLDLYPFWIRERAEERNDFFPNIMDAGFLHHGEYAGTLYGLPRYINMGGTYYYNADLIEGAGLTPIETLVESDNWDWEALREYGRKLTRRNARGTAEQGGLQTDLRAHLYTFILSNGGQVFDYPERPWDFRMNRPEAIEALEFVRQLVWDDQVLFSHSSGRGPEFLGGDWRDQFSSGRVGILMQSFNLNAPHFHEIIGERFRWQNVVPVAAAPNGERRGTNAKDLYGIPATTKHPEEAWLFLNYLVSVDVQRMMMHMSHEMPIRISLLPEFLTLLSELYDIPWRNLQYIADAAHVTQVNPEAVFINASQTAALIHNGIFGPTVWRNQLPVDVAIQQVEDAIRAVQREVVGDLIDR